MSSKFRIHFLLVFLNLFFSFNIWANEAAEKKEGAEAPAASAAKDEYQETFNRATALKAKIKLREDTIEKLILDKQKEKDSKKLSEIIATLVSEHKAMEKEAEEYNQLSSVLRYRFPEKSLPNTKKKFERIEVKDLEDLEKEITLEVRIKNSVHKIKNQYRSAESKDSSNTSEENIQRKKKQESTSSPLLEPVIIEK